MKLAYSIILVCFISTSILAQNSHTTPQTADEDGCYFPPTNRIDPISSTAEWSAYTDGKLIVKHTNNSSGRLYARFCNQINDGSWDCGASGISSGNTNSWSTYNASGRYTIQWVGSIKGSNDWVCSSKVRGWHDN